MICSCQNAAVQATTTADVRTAQCSIVSVSDTKTTACIGVLATVEQNCCRALATLHSAHEVLLCPTSSCSDSCQRRLCLPAYSSKPVRAVWHEVLAG